MKPAPADCLYHTTKTLAQERGVKPRTVLRWIRNGTIIGERLGGGHWRIPKYNYLKKGGAR